MANHEFSIGFSSNTFYLFAIFPALAALALMYTGTRLSPSILYFALGGLVLGISLALAYNGYNLNNLKIQITATDLVVGKHRVAISEIKLDQVRAADLATEPDLAPARRKNGTEISGLREGWWVLKNGERAYVALTREQNGGYVPTSVGYSFLVSPTDRDGFLSALGAKKSGAAATR